MQNKLPCSVQEKKEDTKMSYVNSRTKRKSVIICKETKRKKIQFGRQKKAVKRIQIEFEHK